MFQRLPLCLIIWKIPKTTTIRMISMSPPPQKPKTGTGFTCCRNMRPAVKKEHYGFTLIEIAMVLMIVGLLLGGMLVPLSAQMDQRNVTDTRKQLDEIQQALIGFAIVNGRLPCPASPTSNGVESFVSGGASGGYCSNFNNGFVPAATLGITSTVDNQGNTGFAVDSWGNRIRYAVTSSNGYAFTETNGMSTVGMSSLAPNLIVCSTASGATSSSCASGPPSTALTS